MESVTQTPIQTTHPAGVMNNNRYKYFSEYVKYFETYLLALSLPFICVFKSPINIQISRVKHLICMRQVITLPTDAQKMISQQQLCP